MCVRVCLLNCCCCCCRILFFIHAREHGVCVWVRVDIFTYFVLWKTIQFAVKYTKCYSALGTWYIFYGKWQQAGRKLKWLCLLDSSQINFDTKSDVAYTDALLIVWHYLDEKIERKRKRTVNDCHELNGWRKQNNHSPPRIPASSFCFCSQYARTHKHPNKYREREKDRNEANGKKHNLNFFRWVVMDRALSINAQRPTTYAELHEIGKLLIRTEFTWPL